MVEPNHQRQGGCSYYNGPQSQKSNQINLACRDSWWHWLIDHGVPRNEKGSLLNSCLICRSRRVRGGVNKSPNCVTKTERGM